MEIRLYQPEDDPALLALERQSPRGFPHPFVHFRYRFIERAQLYPQHHTVVATVGGEVAGVSSIVIKQTYVGGEACLLAYSFDSRVHPRFRQQGIGHAMLGEKLAWAKAQGAEGVYSLIVATNKESLGMVQKSGYEKIRLVLYLQFQPYPLLMPLQGQPLCESHCQDIEDIYQAYSHYNLFTPDVTAGVRHLDFQRWHLGNDFQERAALSLYNQAQVYFKIPAEAPWPRTPEEAAHWGKSWVFFDPIGLDSPELFHQLFAYLRDEAVIQGVNKMVWMVDRQETLPYFVLEEAAAQMDYWLMYKSLNGRALDWSRNTYLDPRDL
jgi:GNAT superfamily N-acetyltransferase